MKKYTPHLGHFSIVDACQEPGCPICTITRKTITHYLSQVLADYVDAPELREELCNSMGYCREHAWSLSEIERGNILTVALMYQDILERNAEKALAGIQDAKRSAGPLRRLLKTGKTSAPPLSSHAECPACALTRKVEENALNALLKGLGKQDAELQKALDESGPVCFPHLERALELGANQQGLDILIKIVQKKLAEIRKNLLEFSRKHDYRFQHEPVGDEKYSWKQAIDLIVGSK